MKLLILFISCLAAPSGDSLLPVTTNVEYLYQLLQELTEDHLSETLELVIDQGEESYEELIED